MALTQLCFIAIFLANVVIQLTSSVPITARSAPASTASIRIAGFVVQSCSSTDNTDLTSSYTVGSIAPARPGSSRVYLDALQSYMRNISQMTSGVIANFSSWLDTKDNRIQQCLLSYVSSKYVIQQTAHADLAPEMNGYLYKITQLAIFADVLGNVKNDSGFGECLPTIRKLLAELRNAVCCLKQVVGPSISNNDLVTFVTQDTARVPGFCFTRSDMRRAVIMTLFKRMSPFINS